MHGRVRAVGHATREIRMAIDKRHLEWLVSVAREQMNRGGGATETGADDGNLVCHIRRIVTARDYANERLAGFFRSFSP